MISLRPTDKPRLVRTAEIMGTVISVDARDENAGDEEIERFFAALRADDRRFSTYKPSSEISRFNRGELKLAQLSDDVIEVLELAEKVRYQSHGCFDVWQSQDGSRLDPLGIVKGWAVERAAAVFKDAGWRNYRVNAGGDVIVHGEAAAGKTWRVGIRHPRDGNYLAAVLELTDMAVATSGHYERGPHIVDVNHRGTLGEVVSATVVGPSLTLADAYATALFVQGSAGVAWIDGIEGYEGFAVTAAGRALWTAGLDRYLVGR